MALNINISTEVKTCLLHDLCPVLMTVPQSTYIGSDVSQPKKPEAAWIEDGVLIKKSDRPEFADTTHNTSTYHNDTKEATNQPEEIRTGEFFNSYISILVIFITALFMSKRKTAMRLMLFMCFMKCITPTFATHVWLSQCVGVDLRIKPIDYCDNQTFYMAGFRKRSEPNKYAATWLIGNKIQANSSRIEFVDGADCRNLTILMKNFQRLDAGQYELETILERNNLSVTNHFTVLVDEGCKQPPQDETTVIPFNETTRTETATSPHNVHMPPTVRSPTFRSPTLVSPTSKSPTSRENTSNLINEMTTKHNKTQVTDKITLPVTLAVMFMVMIAVISVIVIYRYYKRLQSNSNQDVYQLEYQSQSMLPSDVV